MTSRYTMEDLLREFAPDYSLVQGVDMKDPTVREDVPDPSAVPVPQPEPTPPQLRIVKEEQSEPLPQASEPIASADPKFRPPPKAEQKESGGWSPSWLAGIAAFTKNPALLQMLKEQQEAPRRKAEADAASAKEQREQEKWQLERDIMSPIKVRKMGSETAAKALSIAGTPESEAMREAIASRFEAQAAQLGHSEWGPMFAKAAANIRGNKAITGMASLDLARQYNVAVDDLARDAATRFRKDSLAADQGMDRRRMSESERHNRVMEEIAGQREERAENRDFEATIKGPQEKLNKEINDLEVALSQMHELAGLKKGVNTGIVMDKLSKVGEKFDLTSDDRNNLNALAARIFNKETKQLAGAAVSASEWARIAPQIPQASDDDNVFMSKLKRATAETQKILGQRRQEYQLRKSGDPVDSSKTARRSVAADKSTGAEWIDPERAARIVRAKAILADPNESPEKKAKAEKWLKLNAK